MVAEFDSFKMKELGINHVDVFVHHPGHYRRKKLSAAEIDLLDILGDQKVRFVLTLFQTSILRKRSDGNIPCDPVGSNEDDSKWIKVAVEMIGCIPPQWKKFFGNVTDSVGTCKTLEKLKKS